ncbi:heavy metal translocating P-type ATPase [Effusibacillus pohliae]|uniref:heavy metal translocating P-type ATPase n=1 Tax=Effusibacillus pohliae TaxID=232270 RepID=UPI000362A97E|nr:heavy metal translocating P-type ATPase [Effusibacillus pohliae]
MEKALNKSVYRLQGLTCAHCASKIEAHLQALPDIKEANLNFAAAKLTIVGTISQEELQKEMKKIENVTIRPIGAPEADVRKSFWEPNRKSITTGVSLLALLIGFTVAANDMLSKTFLLISIAAGGYSVAMKGVRNLFRLNFDMNVLMTIAIVGALLIGEWREAAVVAFLFSISETLESYSMEKARHSIRSLMDIAPKEATVLRHGQEIRTPVEELAVGDVILVRPGEKIAIDGEIIDGTSSINEAAITGESMSVDKTVGDRVYAGTLNQQGAIRVRVTKLVEDTTIAKIIHLVEEAQNERAPAQAFVDKFAKYYTPSVMALSVLIASVPPLFFGGNWSRWIYEALALLVVACPCALVVSTPVAIVSAIGAAAKNGVLIKGGIFLEEAGKLKAIAFDKTGTITKGEPAVTDIVALGDKSQTEILEIAAGIERLSEHPLAKAIVKKAEAEGQSPKAAEEFSAITGKGAWGTIEGETYYIGNPRLFEELHGDVSAVRATISSLQDQGKTVMILGTKKEIIGLLAVADQVREQTVQAIRDLKKSGIDKTIMLTGDNNKTAAAIAKQVGVDEFHGELLPDNKLEKMKQLREQYGKVAMVGDGINDAPALASATVGIAMGGAGTDTALETADIALMADDLSKLPYTVRLGRNAIRVIKQNIAFALVTKLLAVLLVFPGWLTLWLAILADMGATILVTLNGIRLLKSE